MSIADGVACLVATPAATSCICSRICVLCTSLVSSLILANPTQQNHSVTHVRRNIGCNWWHSLIVSDVMLYSTDEPMLIALCSDLLSASHFSRFSIIILLQYKILTAVVRECVIYDEIHDVVTTRAPGMSVSPDVMFDEHVNTKNKQIFEAVTWRIFVLREK